MRPLCMCILPLLLFGCQSMRPSGFPKEMSAVFTQIGTSLGDQAVWQEVATRLGGEVIEPGVEGYAGILYVAGGKITGTAGRLSLEGEGAGVGVLSPEARETILRLSETPDLLDKLLAWAETVGADAESPD